MEWNQPPRKKIVPECVGEISSTKECCAVDREEKEEEEDSEVFAPVVWRRELDVPPHGGTQVAEFGLGAQDVTVETACPIKAGPPWGYFSHHWS